jgi:uncharacterized protein (TIGR00369 family)
MGLQMAFYRQGEAVCSDLTLDARFVGWENMAHGGVISAVLDEVMAWAILYFKQSFCVTRKITVRFLKPVPVSTPITARGRLVSSRRTYTCLTEGELVDRAGTVLARAEADFALLTDEQIELLPLKVRADMARYIEQFEAVVSDSPVTR